MNVVQILTETSFYQAELGIAMGPESFWYRIQMIFYVISSLFGVPDFHAKGHFRY